MSFTNGDWDNPDDGRVVTEQRCNCGNKATEDGKCDWCANPECEILVEIEGVASGTMIGTCMDGRPIFRSHMAGTIYHATEDR